MRLKHMLEATQPTPSEPLPTRSGSTRTTLRAAVAVFAEKGFAAATVREICARAGPTCRGELPLRVQGAPLRHGPGLHHGRPRGAGGAGGRGRGGRPPEERLAAFVRAFVRSIYQTPENFAGARAGPSSSSKWPAPRRAWTRWWSATSNRTPRPWAASWPCSWARPPARRPCGPAPRAWWGRSSTTAPCGPSPGACPGTGRGPGLDGGPGRKRAPVLLAGIAAVRRDFSPAPRPQPADPSPGAAMPADIAS
jgi:hypothetical protein